MKMEHVLNQLNLYCGDILGEQSKATKDKKKRDRKSIKSNILQNNNNVTDKSVRSEVSLLKNKLSKADKNESRPEIENSDEHVFKSEMKHYTEDGFEILRDIPPDDSDISDAFTYDYEDHEEEITLVDGINSKIKKQKNKGISSKNDKFTEDGFKITRVIPPDDSDVSDAFDSDCEDMESSLDVGKGKEIEKRLATNGKMYEKLKKLKKPYLQLICDFGMEDKLFSKEKCIPKDLLSQNLNIIDYSKKRGKSKTVNLNPVPNENKTKNVEEKEQFKKARYDIFKFGISGFEKEEKKNLKIALAIKLGAKPPKNKAKNYKTIIEERMKEKKLEREKLELKDDPLSKIKAKAIAKKKENAQLHGITTGKFRGGMLKLSKSDIKKIQSSR